jgi:BMFP domain-containing protein YqiC
MNTQQLAAMNARLAEMEARIAALEAKIAVQPPAKTLTLPKKADA